jgi:hypothetical protein
MHADDPHSEDPHVQRQTGAPPAPEELPPVDYGGPTTVAELPVVEPPRTEPPGREFTRNLLTLGLYLLLAILTIATLAATIAGVNTESLARIAEITVSPVVALCGTAFGFYYAERRHR